MALIQKTLEEIKRDAAARPGERLPRPSPEEIRKAAESDPDTWLPTKEQLKRFKPWRERAAAKETRAFSEGGKKFEDKE
ncbi:MAG: hypothetical protein ABL957_07310 [Parvularculaceae bacterium]